MSIQNTVRHLKYKFLTYKRISEAYLEHCQTHIRLTILQKYKMLQPNCYSQPCHKI